MEKDYAKEYPINVFKFYSLTNYSIDSFLNRYLYLSHPYELNDLMDIRPYSLDMRDFTQEKFKELKQEAIERSPLIGNILQINNVETQNQYGLYALQDLIFNSFFAFGGVISLASKDRFNELMWSHYAKESGFMLEFITSNLLKDSENIDNNKLFDQIMFHPIQYKPHPIGIKCVECSSLHEINKKNSYQKYNGWSYENEWRILATSKQYLGRYNYYTEEQEKEFSLRKLYYSIDTVKRIYIGKRFWTRANFIVKDKQIDKENEIRQYTIEKPEKCCEIKRYNLFIEFLQKLSELMNIGIEVYMSGACDCSEYRHGTDHPTCDKKNWKCEYNPKQYYITRSFEKIENISLKENLIEVTYSGKFLTKDCDFE